MIAFEPDPIAFARLKQTLERNSVRDVRPINAAVAGEDGMVPFYSEPGDTGGITAGLNASWSGAVAREVRAVRLSAMIREPVDFLKLDVEGAEYAVICDLVETGTIDYLREAVIEFHEPGADVGGVEQMVRLLEASGMQVSRSGVADRARVGIVRAWRADGT